MLETCKNAKQAVDLIAESKRAGGAIITIADANGNIKTIELSSNHHAIRNEEGSPVVSTNHFFTNEMKKIEVSKKIDNYDFIIIGSPVWADGITPAIRTFIENNDFSNKEIACFMTLKGANPEKALENMKEAILPQIPLSELGITDDLKNRDKSEQQIIEWCNEIQKIRE